MAQWLSSSVTQWLSGSVAQWLSGSAAQRLSGSAAQWLTDSRLREPVFESCVAVSKFGQLVYSIASRVNECLAWTMAHFYTSGLRALIVRGWILHRSVGNNTYNVLITTED